MTSYVAYATELILNWQYTRRYQNGEIDHPVYLAVRGNRDSLPPGIYGLRRSFRLVVRSKKTAYGFVTNQLWCSLSSGVSLLSLAMRVTIGTNLFGAVGGT